MISGRIDRGAINVEFRLKEILYEKGFKKFTPTDELLTRLSIMVGHTMSRKRFYAILNRKKQPLLNEAVAISVLFEIKLNDLSQIDIPDHLDSVRISIANQYK